MTTDAGHNGWANYETWVTALWIDNDPGTYEESRAIVRDCFEQVEGDEQATPRVSAADALKDWADETFVAPYTEEGPAGLAVDLLGHAFSSVDWIEIVDAIRGES